MSQLNILSKTSKRNQTDLGIDTAGRYCSMLRKWRIALSVFILLAYLLRTDSFAQDALVAEPTQAKFIETLKTIVDQLEQKQYAETEKYFFLPPNFTPDKFANLLKRNVISAAGIDVLAEQGTFGKATDVFGEKRATRYAEDFEADVANCYAMELEQPDATAQVMAQWDGSLFKIIRLNRVGYLVGSNDTEADTATDNADAAKMPSGEEPTEQLMLDSLAVVLSHLENRQYSAAKDNFFLPPGFRNEMFDKLLEINEISKEGLEIMRASAEFGPATEVFEQHRAEHFAERAKVPVDQCYAIVAESNGEQGEAMAQWTGTKFKFIRIDDIGKLSAVPSPPSR